MFHHIRSCDKTGNVDNLFSLYEEHRNNIIKLMNTDTNELKEKMWTYNSPITIDRKCKCRMGRGNETTDFICFHCYNIKRMTKFSKDVVGAPFVISYGKKTGEKIIIVKYNIGDLFLQEDTLFRNRCDEPCIVGDSFTINSLINIYFQKYFENPTSPNFVSYMYTSFVCNNDGYCIYKVPTIGSINSLMKRDEYFYTKDGEKAILPNVIRGIVIQLIMILTELSKFKFTHGAPTAHSLLFSDSHVTGSYDQINIDAPVNVELTNFNRSSASIGGVRYYTKGIVDDVNIENFVFMTTGEYTGCEKKFKINTSSSMQTTLNTLGFSNYRSSYDFYMFMISLLSYPEIMNGFTGDSKLSRVWSAMWGYEQEAVDLNITTSDPSSIIRDKWLKCNILQEVRELLK